MLPLPDETGLPFSGRELKAKETRDLLSRVALPEGWRLGVWTLVERLQRPSAFGVAENDMKVRAREAGVSKGTFYLKNGIKS